MEFKIDISIVVPLYNEVESIPELHTWMQASQTGQVGQVVVQDHMCNIAAIVVLSIDRHMRFHEAAEVLPFCFLVPGALYHVK